MTSSTKSQPDPMSICAGGSRMETSGISEFRKQKLEHNAQKNWDRFYLRNSTAFFKNRHWPRNEFVELLPELVSGEAKVLLECGCGVGNLAFPLLEYFPDLFVYACDFSPRAIEYVKSNEFYRENRVVAFTTDLTRDALSSSIPIASVDVCTLVFVLSSIDPEKVLKSTGSVFIRDYAQGDYAQQRFGDHQKLEENFYVRQDGTRSYFFTKEVLSKAFVNNGFCEASITYLHRETVNRKDNISVPRLFIQAKFKKVALPKNPFRSSLVITWTIALVMVKAERNVFFFIPNLIGYMRVVLTVLSCYYMATHYRAAALFYVCSSLLDAVDGYAARYFNQSSLFGAMLDMLTDRCTTLCLLSSQLWMCQAIGSICIGNHHDLLGSKSHKNVSSTTSPLLRLYYTSKAFLFLMCFGNEAFFWALYVAHFDPGPIIPLLEVRCMTALAFLSFPIALVKSGISVVHLITAAKSIARIDAKPVR
ncbi:methyltransferase domain protein [Trichuris suis]|nr:methyltransferase domain protein [Trichuris suis]